MGPLDAKEMQQLKGFLSTAATKDLKVVLDVHDYAHFNFGWQAEAAQKNSFPEPGLNKTRSTPALGTKMLPIAAFTDLWSRLATALKGQPGVAGYDLMNEPEGLPDSTTWPRSAQAAIDTIRKIDATVTIIVEGDSWSSAKNWAVNKAFPLKDSSNNIVYEAHQYFDDSTGSYTSPYDAYEINPLSAVNLVMPFVQWVKNNHVKGYLGEFGVPASDIRWQPLVDNLLNYLRKNKITATQWYMTYDNGPRGHNQAWVSQHYGNSKILGVPATMSLNPDAAGNESIQWSVLKKYTAVNQKLHCWTGH